MLKRKFNFNLNLKRKLLTTPCLITLLCGCGKEIKTSQNDLESMDRRYVKATNIILNINYNTADKTDALITYKSTRSGWLVIPHHPFIKGGSPSIINSKIYFNLKSADHLSSEMFCEYTSIRISSDQLVNQNNEQTSKLNYTHFFNGCSGDFEKSGIPQELNYQPGDELPLDSGNYIVVQLKSTTSDDNIEFESEIEVDWH